LLLNVGAFDAALKAGNPAMGQVRILTRWGHFLRGVNTIRPSSIFSSSGTPCRISSRRVDAVPHNVGIGYHRFLVFHIGEREFLVKRPLLMLINVECSQPAALSTAGAIRCSKGQLRRFGSLCLDTRQHPPL
jgi:hypothetical protein